MCDLCNASEFAKIRHVGAGQALYRVCLGSTCMCHFKNRHNDIPWHLLGMIVHQQQSSMRLC